jgi:hypothetical protein
MRAGKNQSDIEAELESKDPTEMGDDVISFKDEGDQEVVATSVEHRDPVIMSVSDGRDVERRGDVPMPRKCVASSDAISEREAKQTWSSRSLEASPALSPPTLGVVG